MVEAHREEIAKLEALYAAHPEGRVFTHLAEAYRRAGELDRARGILEDGLRRHPDYSSAHVVFGRVLMDLGETTSATSAFRRVLDLDRHNLVALRSLGDLSETSGDRAAAVGYYRDLRALDPTDDWLRMTVSRLEEELRAPGPAPQEAGATEEAEARLQDETGHELAGAEVRDEVEMSPPEDVAPLADLEVFETAAPEEEPAREDLGAFSLGWHEAVELEDDLTASPFGGGEILETEVPELPMLAGDELDVAENGRSTELPDAFAGLGWIDEPAEESILEGLELPTEPFAEPVPEETPVADDETWTSMGERAEADWSPAAEPAQEMPGEERVEEVTTWGPPEETWLTEPPPHETLLDADTEPFKAGEPPAEVVTETMAELYARQGFYGRAIEVYRQLIGQVPEDVRLRERLREIEALDAAVTAARGDEQQSEALAWSATYEVEETETEAWVESVESAWTGGGGVAGAEETPYAWAGSSAADEGAAASGTTAGEYFRILLGWRPAQAVLPEAEDMLELTDEQAVAPPAVGPDEDEIVLDAGAVEAAFEEWFGGEPPAGASADDATQEERGEVSEADADLEMFRSWLQSLKK